MTYSLAHTGPADADIRLGTARISFNKILVTTDFSEESKVALQIAGSLAHLFGASVTIANCIPQLMYATGLEAVSMDLLSVEVNGIKEQMAREVAACPELRGLDHEEVVECGALLPFVNELVESRAIDLIVCGTHGASGVEKFLVGSTAEYLLRHVSCPVLFVGPKCGTRSFHSNSILFCTRLGISASRPAQYAAALAEEMNARLTLLHVASLEGNDPTDERAIQQLYRGLRALLPRDAEDWCNLKTCVEFGEFEAIAKIYLQQEMADLMILGVNEGGALADHAPWSTLSNVIREATCPVLAVRSRFV